MLTVEYDMLSSLSSVGGRPKVGQNVMDWIQNLYGRMGAKTNPNEDVLRAVVKKVEGPAGGNPVVTLSFANMNGLRNFCRVWVAAETSGNVARVKEEDVESEFQFASERAEGMTAGF